MAAASTRHQHRHFKTLIMLVLAMTGGAVSLFYLAQASPVTPLSGRSASPSSWNAIAIRTASSDEDRGFYHFRIDESGRVFQSGAWQRSRSHPDTPGAVHILVTTDRPGQRVSPAQAATLSRTLNDLQSRLAIPDSRVVVAGENAPSSDGERYVRLTSL